MTLNNRFQRLALRATAETERSAGQVEHPTR